MRKKIKAIDKRLGKYKWYQGIVFLPRLLLRFIRCIRRNGIRYTIRSIFVKMYQRVGGRRPIVSIVIPVYNVENYLEQALDSLLNQSMKHIEIIAVDDGSTDSSLEILKRYEMMDRRVKVFTQKNQYAGVARNLGLSKARGEYILFLDSDDFFDKNLVKETYYAAKVNRADVVIFGANYYDDLTGKKWKGRWLLDTSFAPKKQPFNYKDCPESIFQITTACPWTKIFRREFIERTGLQFQNLHNTNDVFFVLSGVAMAERIVTVDKELVNYRIGLKKNLQSCKKRHILEAFSAWHDQLKELEMLEKVRKSYTNFVLNACMYNLRTVNDCEAKKEIFDTIKNEMFDLLEIFDYDESYYYHKKNYEEMLYIKGHSFEQYMENYIVE